MNKQPYYHCATVLFTAMQPIDEHSFRLIVQAGVTEETGIIRSTVIIEDYEEPEAGDPADLT